MSRISAGRNLCLSHALHLTAAGKTSSELGGAATGLMQISVDAETSKKRRPVGSHLGRGAFFFHSVGPLRPRQAGSTIKWFELIAPCRLAVLIGYVGHESTAGAGHRRPDGWP